MSVAQISFTPEGLGDVPLNTEIRFLGTKCPDTSERADLQVCPGSLGTQRSLLLASHQPS